MVVRSRRFVAAAEGPLDGKQMRSTTFLFCILISRFSICAAENHQSAALHRIRSDIEFLASDDLEGRGVATEGIKLAAERIIAVFRQTGLKSVLPDGGWRQTFDIKIGSVGVSEQTSLTLRSARGTRLQLTANLDFQPLLRGSGGKSSGELVFLGYGVSSPEDGYDDYADIDVEGRTIVIIRRVPGQGTPDAPFSGDSTSPHAYITTKLRLAQQHKVAAVLMVNDPYTTPDPDADELTAVDGFGSHGGPVPFVQIHQRLLDRLLSENPVRTPDGELLSTLRAVAGHLDESLTPLSQVLTSWKVDLEVKFTGDTAHASNLIGMVEGQGAAAHETIIVGGHYDHIGYGDYGSRARNRRGEIHNGADDNASGVAAVLELARRLAAGPAPQRRILLICFSGEERGLLGSRHYTRQPVFPLDDTVFMLNLDMIGSARNSRVEINGVGTAVEFLPLVELADEQSPMDVRIVANPFAGSDHLPFYRKQIPVMFCFTGITDRYHTPDDDSEMINMDGVVSIVDLSEQLLRSIDALPARPEYRRTGRGRIRMAVLGIRPALSGHEDAQGVRVLGVRPGSPAANASVQVGDLIVKIDSQPIEDYAALYDFLCEVTGGTRVLITVERDGQRIRLQTRLEHANR